MVGVGCLKKLLKVIGSLACLALEIPLDSDNKFLIRVIDLLVIVSLVSTGHKCDLLGSPLEPPLAAFNAPLCPIAGCFGWHLSAAAGDCLPIALDKNGPDYLFTGGMPGGDIEQLLRGLWLVLAELMHKGLTACAGLEYRDEVDVTDLGEVMAFSGETLNVIPERLA
jgi:hypothetical protein